MKIPFNKPYLTGIERHNITEALQERFLVGDGRYTKLCHQWLEQNLEVQKALLTPSCTAALEMASVLLDIKPGDEIIMPSFTFVSSANPFVLRGGIPVFVDIRPDTLNIDEKKIEAAITKKTRAILAVHYAGVSCEMTIILEVAKRHGLFVVEDAAHGILARYGEKYLGSMGHVSALSFHGTKNIVCGEGGAILMNDKSLLEKAEITWEKGTNRARFFRGQVDKYTWVDVGSSYLPSEITAAFLAAQLEKAVEINEMRLRIWDQYHHAFSELVGSGKLGIPSVPQGCDHNAHLYYLILPSLAVRTRFITSMKEKEIGTAFHYVPLHNSPAGLKFGRVHGKLNYTEDLSDRQVRLPLWPEMTSEDISRVIEEVAQFMKTV